MDDIVLIIKLDVGEVVKGFFKASLIDTDISDYCDIPVDKNDEIVMILFEIEHVEEPDKDDELRELVI